MAAKKSTPVSKTTATPAKKAAATKTVAKKAPAAKAAGTKTVAKQAPAKKAPVKTAAAKPPVSPPTPADIARVAYLNYRNRIATGVPGDHHSDWLEAERLLKGE